MTGCLIFRLKLGGSDKEITSTSYSIAMSIKLNSTQLGILCLISILSIFIGCGQPNFEYSIETQLNPYNLAPLTALLKIKAEKPCRASIKVLGKMPMEQSFEEFSDSLNIPVLGLYPDTINEVVVTLQYEGGQVEETVKIKTDAIPASFPDIEINKIDRQSMEPGWHACDIHYAQHGKFHSIPMAFDDDGKVRWYLDLSFAEEMVGPFQILSNGAILMSSRHVIYEFDMLGQLLRKTDVDQNYGMHRDKVELPDGTLLICVGKRNDIINLDGVETISDSDFIMHFDRKNGKILKEWDMAKHLDVSRKDINHLRPGDWFHMNGLAFNEKDSTIIVSGKNQGLAKISWNDELQWIMSPKRSWENAGRDGKGFDTRPFLLTAINAEGKPYAKEIQDGTVSADDFDFPWGQHSPMLLPNGNILVFDNGAVRNFVLKPNYSRAVEYKVDEKNRTVEQVWQYGKERGIDFFSLIISDVDYLPNTKNILVTSGHLRPDARYSAKIVEVDYATGKEVFEATLYYKSLNGNKTFAWGQMDILFRSERMALKYIKPE